MDPQSCFAYLAPAVFLLDACPDPALQNRWATFKFGKKLPEPYAENDVTDYFGTGTTSTDIWVSAPIFNLICF